jgi:hypothetical protein
MNLPIRLFDMLDAGQKQKTHPACFLGWVLRA